MTIKYLSSKRIQGLSSDMKPTNIEDGTEFVETDTGDVYIINSGIWSLLNSATGGGTLNLGDLNNVDETTIPPINNDVLTWNSTDSEWVPAAPPGAGGGEANTSSNVGTGEGTLAKTKVGVDLPFKTVKQGTDIVLANNADDVTISAGAEVLNTTNIKTISNKELDIINNTIRNLGSHNYEVFKQSTTWYARNTRTGAITSSGTNLTTVLQAAIDALTVSRTWKESIKVFGDGEFGQILIPSYTRLDFTDFKLTVTTNTNKSVLTNTATPFHATTNPVLAAAASHIEIIGGYFDGNRFNQSDTTSVDQDKNLIYLENVSDAIIINPWIIRPQNDGIRLHTCTRCVVFNPYVENSRSEGTSIRDGSDNIVIGGNYKNIGWSFITTLNSPRTKFLYGYGDTNGILGATTTGLNVSSEDCVVDGWTIRNATGNGITFGDSVGVIYSPNGSVVDNCTIDAAGVNGFSCVVFAATNIKIKNSTFRNCGEYGVRPAGGDVNIFTVENCTIHDNQKAGILVNGVLSGGLIPTNGIFKNNNIYNNGKGLGTDQERSGITITGDSADAVVGIIVEGNNCFDNQGTKTQKYGVRLNNTNKVQFRFNTLYDNLTDGYQLVGTNNNLENIANEGHSVENNLVGTQQANSYGAVTQTFRTGRLRVGNTPNSNFATFDYSAGIATVNMNIPALTVSDDIVFRTFGQALTTKNINLTNNTVTDTSAASYDVPVHNGTKFVRGNLYDTMKQNKLFSEFYIADGSYGSGLFGSLAALYGAGSDSSTGWGGDTVDGQYRFYGTGTDSAGSIKGRATNLVSSFRKYSPRMFFVFKIFNSTTNVAIGIGFASVSDGTHLHTTTPLANKHGVILATTTSDANYQIFHNAGTATATKVATSVAKSTTPRYCEIYTDDTNWYVNLEGDSQIRTLSTNIPSSIQGLYMTWGILTNDTTDRFLYIYKILHQINSY